MCFDKFFPIFAGQKSALTLLMDVRWGMELHIGIRKLVLFLHKSKYELAQTFTEKLNLFFKN